MKAGRQGHLTHGTHRPTRRDRVIVLLVSLSLLLVLLPLAHLIHASVVGWIVLLAVIGLPGATINVLLALSRWETSQREEPPLY